MSDNPRAESSPRTSHHSDVLVLGAGPGGYIAAIRAAQLGFSVTIVEREFWGGVCLNVGCIPTKALVKNAEVAHFMQHRASEFGVYAEGVHADYGVAHARSRSVSQRIVKGVHYLMRKNGISQVTGEGSFVDDHTLQVGETSYTFDYAIIATGSHAAALPGVSTPVGGPVMTYREHILSPDLPESMVIIGAGALGAEWASIMAAYDVEVTLVEYQDRVLPLEDAAISSEMEKQMKKQGIILRTGHKTTDIRVEDDGSVTVEVQSRDGGREDLHVERCLIATGFTPTVDGYGLENTGVELTERRAIAVDRHMRTSVPHIYAIGDVTALLMVAHVAEAQGVIAAEDIAQRTANGNDRNDSNDGNNGKDIAAPQHPMPLIDDYLGVPTAVFTLPCVASVGLTEQAARALHKDRPITVSIFPLSANGKAVALGEPTGFIKVVADKEFGEIYGAHIVGHEAAELIAEYALARQWELTTEEIGHTIHVHPTVSEVLKEAAEGVLGSPLNL